MRTSNEAGSSTKEAPVASPSEDPSSLQELSAERLQRFANCVMEGKGKITVPSS